MALTLTVTWPPGRRDAECRMAFVTSFEVISATAFAVEPSANPATQTRAAATDSGQPAKARV